MTFRSVFACAILASLFAISGCYRPTQISSANRKLLQALQTAASAKKTEWLLDVESKLAAKREKNELSDDEFKAFDSIIKRAKAGDWKQANLDALALCEAQQPTAQELEKFNSRKNAK